MNIIKFNTVECEVISFAKNTYFNNGQMSGTISCAIKTDNIDSLSALGNTAITSIQILHDEDVIYDLNNTTFYVDNISEYLNMDQIDITLNLSIHQEPSPEVI